MERPILFSGPMVRAILAGKKTQTRRVVTGRTALEWLAPGTFTPSFVADPGNYISPFGYAGDRLWVRETWRYHDWDEDGLPWVEYRADGATLFRDCDVVPEEWAERLTDIWAELSDPTNYARHNRAADPRWRPSIHMPRWASRITLNVTDVRVERLQEITEDDARREGIAEYQFARGVLADGWFPTKAFADLWDSLNDARGYGWATNPWVWVVTFSALPPNSESDDRRSA